MITITEKIVWKSEYYGLIEFPEGPELARVRQSARLLMDHLDAKPALASDILVQNDDDEPINQVLEQVNLNLNRRVD